MTFYRKIIMQGLRILPGIPLLLLVPAAAASADMNPSGFVVAQAQQKPLAGNKESVTSQVQEELKKRGYYDGPVDGTVSPKTRSAAMRFQSDAGLPVSGSVNEELLNSLRTADKDVRRKSG